MFKHSTLLSSPALALSLCERSSHTPTSPSSLLFSPFDSYAKFFSLPPIFMSMDVNALRDQGTPSALFTYASFRSSLKYFVPPNGIFCLTRALPGKAPAVQIVKVPNLSLISSMVCVSHSSLFTLSKRLI